MAIRSFTLTEAPKLVPDLHRHPGIWEDQRQSVKLYCDEVKKGKGKVEIQYVMYRKYGRYLVKNSHMRSCTIMYNSLRGPLFGDTEIDIDIVNCHPNILLSLVPENVDAEALASYCKNREQVIEMFTFDRKQLADYNQKRQTNYECKDLVKTLFTILMYGGTVATWEKEFELDNSTYTSPAFLNEYIDELQMLTSIIVRDKRFQDIKLETYQYKMTKEKERKGAAFDEEKFTVSKSKHLAVILQDYERRIVETAMEFLKDNGVTLTSYNYDGFQVLKDGFQVEIMERLNEHIQTKFWSNVSFIVKPFKAGLDLTNIPAQKTCFDLKHFQLLKSYEEKKAYFERYHCKCLNPVCYIKMDDFGKVQMLKDAQLVTCYRHLFYMKCDEKLKKEYIDEFIRAWLHDATMKVYDAFDIFPPPMVCPPGVLNGWAPYPIERVELDLEADTSRIYRHFDYVSNHDKTLKEYLLNWCAHVLQKPATKTRICLLIQGKQGSGKSCIAEELFQQIIGEDRIFVTARTDKAFGKFSDLHGKQLVVLNEASGKDTFEICEIIKDAITCKRLALEKKGLDPVQVLDFCNFVFTTNNLNSVKLDEDDRRFMAFEVDNSIKNNKEYFTPLYADFNNLSIMRKVYEDLMKRDISEWDPVNDRPITKLDQTMKALNVDPLVTFDTYLKEEVLPTIDTNPVTGKVEIKANALYDHFKRFWADEGRKSEHMMTKTKFGVLVADKYEKIKRSCCNWYLFCPVDISASSHVVLTPHSSPKQTVRAEEESSDLEPWKPLQARCAPL